MKTDKANDEATKCKLCKRGVLLPGKRFRFPQGLAVMGFLTMFVAFPCIIYFAYIWLGEHQGEFMSTRERTSASKRVIWFSVLLAVGEIFTLRKRCRVCSLCSTKFPLEEKEGATD